MPAAVNCPARASQHLDRLDVLGVRRSVVAAGDVEAVEDDVLCGEPAHGVEREVLGSEVVLLVDARHVVERALKAGNGGVPQDLLGHDVDLLGSESRGVTVLVPL